MIGEILLTIGVIVAYILPKTDRLLLPPGSIPIDFIIILWPLTSLLIEVKASLLSLMLIIIMIPIPILFYTYCLSNIASVLVAICIFLTIMIYKSERRYLILLLTLWLSYLLYITSFSYKDRNG